MKTTLKRGVGRGAEVKASAEAVNGAGRPTVTVYGPEEPPRTGSRVARVFGWIGIVLAVLIAGTLSGVYLWAHENVKGVNARSVDVKTASKTLDAPLPGQPATVLVIGYDHRANEGKNTPSRSDTIMLVRADPQAKTLSMLSFPRDMRVEIACPGQAPWTDKINAAYAHCGSKGTVETIRRLTGVRVNYLMTVNFRGFRQLVDKIGGIWIDVDRRYYNNQGGPYGYATINIQPGYQKLTGMRALDFVRFRHTDSDLFRNARQQLFVRAFKDQVGANFSPTSVPRLVTVVRKNVEVAQGGGKDISFRTVLRYALLAYSLPAGHVFQARIDGLEGSSELTTASENIQRAVREFSNPDVASPQKATQVALGEKVKSRAPLPRDTTVTVLNGNGVTGSASEANYSLGQRSYRMVLPPNGVPANAPSYDFFRTTIYFDPARKGSKLAAGKLSSLFGTADSKPMTQAISGLANGSMLVVVVGQTFHGRLASAPIDQTPEKTKADVVIGTSASLDLLRSARSQVPFPVMVPTVIDRSSWIDSEKPIRVYYMDKDRNQHKTVRLTYRFGGVNEYWGIQMTDWDGAPVLSGRNFVRRIKGRRYELYYNGPHLHMVVLRTKDASYWVVNSLLDRMSNETMIAIAKGLKPFGAVNR